MIRKKIKIVTLIFIGIVLFLSVGYCNAEKEKKWPVVAKLEKSVYFEDAHKAEAKFTIVGDDGKPLYLIECHTWEYEKDPDFDYSGDFECRLTSLYSPNYYSTLFTYNPKATRDWESRARFLVEELQGKCGDYPEYGRVRHFRLRGMKITLSINDLKIKANADHAIKKESPQIQSFRFDLLVEPDPAALSEIAEPVPYAEPPRVHPEDKNDMSRNCETVILRGK
jgi:hypothetical protein